MPRNGSGVFSVETPILVRAQRSSTAVNGDFTDMGDEITNTMAVDGQTTATAQIPVVDGSLGTPGVGWATDTNTGFRRANPDEMRWVAGATDRFYVDSAGNAWLLGAVDIAGALVVNSTVSGSNDVAALEALTTTGLARRLAANSWSLDDGSVSITFRRDGNGTVLPTGILGDLRVPFTGTLTSITLLGDQTSSGSTVIDIWKDTLANYPPTVADSIMPAQHAHITSASKYEDTALSGWTTAFTAGDILRFNLQSVTDITRLEVILKVKRFI